MTHLYDLTVERVRSPLAVGTRELRFGWKIASDARDVRQTAYRLSLSEADGPLVWEGEEAGDKTVDVVPPVELEAGKRYVWTITSYTTDGVCRAEDAFCTSHELTASFVKPRRHIEGACVYVRREFVCGKPVRRAVAYAAGLGYGTLYLNGRRVDEIYYDAPLTNYDKVVLCRAYDLSGLIGRENCVGMHVGEGFYAQSRVWKNKGMKFGDVCCWVQIEIEYEDGSTERILTDGTWQTMPSPTLLSNVYAGEVRDARLDDPAWCTFGYQSEALSPAVPDTTPKGVLKAALMPPCRVIRRIKPVDVWEINGPYGGVWVFDMGENFAGTLTLRPPKSAEGATYVLRCAETIDEHGQLDHRSIGVYHTYCLQQHIYIASGGDGEEWTPEFCWHGFRYVELTGLYGREASTDMLEGVAISTDFETRGTFETSDEDMTRLQALLLRTIRSNYHGIPEDCPAREKCGWLGDAQIVSDTAIFNFEMAASYEKYLEDIRTSRQVFGDWPMIAPGRRFCEEATPLWGCAQIVIPYKLYMLCGDERPLRQYYPDMCEWIRHEERRSEDHIVREGLGDWLPPVGNNDPRRIPVEQSSTLAFFESAALLAEICRVIGEDPAPYEKLAGEIRAAFNRHYFDADKHSYGSCAANGAAWTLGVCPDGEREALVHATHELIVREGYVMTTGIWGNKYLLPMLWERGLGDDAKRILFGRGSFDFGTMMDAGATSVWERLEENDHLQRPGKVGSFDHPMHGGFAYLFYSHLAGIRPLEAGFATFEIAPCTEGAPERLRAVCESPHGRIVSEREGGRLTVTVPANTRCTVRFGSVRETVGSGTYVFVREGAV
ncbi:MAG: family 78 glycoside hydrolase catalytic domain [Clostridia bacterium]|nr:family 78 glycoside hydrolase catalytic domain [Clostridia bacterium]